MYDGHSCPSFGATPYPPHGHRLTQIVSNTIPLPSLAPLSPKKWGRGEPGKSRARRGWGTNPSSNQTIPTSFGLTGEASARLVLYCAQTNRVIGVKRHPLVTYANSFWITCPFSILIILRSWLFCENWILFGSSPKR